MPAVDTLPARDGEQPRTVTLAQAAQLLGVSVPTVRRRVKQGSLPARKVDGPNGPEYRVLLEQGAQHPTVVNGAVAHPVNGHRAQRQGGRRDHPDERVDLSSLTALVDKLTQQNLEMAGRLGFLQAQLQAKDEQIRALTAPREPEAEEVAERAELVETIKAKLIGMDEARLDVTVRPPRPWWKFW